MNQHRDPTGAASTSARIALIVDAAHTGSPEFFNLFSGYQWDSLRGKLLRSGIGTEGLSVFSLREIETLGSDLGPIETLVGFGESVLRHFTEKRGIDKWQLSPLKTKCGRNFIPTYDLGRSQKQYELNLYQELALHRAYEITKSPYPPAVERFLLNPPLEETFAILETLETCPEIAVDVETGYGQINTIGFAWSPSDAIAINVLPDRCSDHSYLELFERIRRVLESPSRKIFQNFIYDTSYFSSYGIRVRGEIFDTMFAMKFLYPELKSNLGNVGRLYTKRVYWKDDGKVTDEEGAKKNWGDVRDWVRHYTYNCRDTTGTLEASLNQRLDLRQRNMEHVFNGYLLSLIDPVREMCGNGMPVDLSVRESLKKEGEAKVAELIKEFQEIAGEINPASPKQILSYLTAKGIKIPKKYDKEKGIYKESTDSSSIKKIRLKYPEMKELGSLQGIKSLSKALSSYINFEVRPDGKLPFSLNICGTETLRWSGNKDAWDRGFNIQTIPREGGEVSIKSMFVAPEGFSFIEVDLRQAESRFVAYDSADKTLIDMLESGADVHSHVGKAILRQMGRDPEIIPKAEFKETWRQLGKKAGHGLNYYMKPAMFVETVFNELDLVISKKDAELITEAYYGLFPGIPRWHAWIRSELYTKRRLSAPSGWERYFYGRPGDDMNKEAYAWRPQHTIPWLTNHLMLHLIDLRKHGSLKFHLIYQCHDSLVMLARDGEIEKIAKVCLDTKAGHPVVDLPGGRLWIPREVKAGKCLATAEEVK
jgi:DNA polymerase I-like protein with 3'-5' exonuclease and polymerase domains